jgi:thiol-disulfide isomerase/thioredoxin
MLFLNHYSAAIIGMLIFVIVFSAVRRRRQWWVPAGVMIVYGAVWLALRPVASQGMQPAGKPLLLEIQSPCCLGCVAMKPAVDRVQSELRDRLNVRRVDIQSDEGRHLAREYRVEFTPTFILFDPAGKERWRGVGQLDAAQVRSACR